MVGYRTTVMTYFAISFMNNDLPDQVQWLQEQSMPEGVSAIALVARIKKINLYLSMLPGAGGNEPFSNDPANAQPTLKGLVYQMMPQAWKNKFLDNDNDITHNQNTMLHLEKFMKRLEQISATEKRKTTYSSSRSRSRSNDTDVLDNSTAVAPLLKIPDRLVNTIPAVKDLQVVGETIFLQTKTMPSSRKGILLVLGMENINGTLATEILTAIVIVTGSV